MKHFPSAPNSLVRRTELEVFYGDGSGRHLQESTVKQLGLGEEWNICLGEGLIEYPKRWPFAEYSTTVVGPFLSGRGRSVRAQRHIEAAKPTQTPPVEVVDWNEYRDERRPNGNLLTVAYCEERYNIRGPELSKAAKADPSIRRKNPAGPGYVYLYTVIRDMADRKSRDD